MKTLAIWCMLSVAPLANALQLEEFAAAALPSTRESSELRSFVNADGTMTSQVHKPSKPSKPSKCADRFNWCKQKQSRCNSGHHAKYYAQYCPNTCGACRTMTCLAKDASVVVIGGGPSGIHMAMELKQRGYTNVVVLEKNKEPSRFGKGQSYKLEETDTVPHELGTCYLSSSYDNIRALLKKYVGPNATIVPGGAHHNKVMLSSPKLQGTMGLPQNIELLKDQYIALNVNRHKGWTDMKNMTTYWGVLAEEITKYGKLHTEIFGEYNPHGLPPKPAADKMKLIKKSYYDFMIENGFPNLLDYTSLGLGSYGFGFDIPALYGLIMMNPINTANVVDPNPNKVPTIEILKLGFSNLWEQIVSQEQIDLRRGHVVTNVRQDGDGFQVMAEVVDSSADQTQIFHADELMFATPVSKLMAQNMLKRPSPLERMIANNLQYVGLNIGLHKAPKHVLKVLADSQTPPEVPDQALVFFPEPLMRDFTSDGSSGGVYAERNDVLAYNESADAALDSRYVMTYQHFTRANFNETDANAKARELFDGNDEYEFVTSRAYKDYLPHFNPATIQAGLPWKIFESQGAGHKWYLGSSVSFESAEDVVSYNKQVLAKASSIFCPK